MTNDEPARLRAALDAIRPLATFFRPLLAAADGPGDQLPDEVERQLPEAAELTRTALGAIESAPFGGGDYHAIQTLSLALLALRALKQPDAAEGIENGRRAAVVGIAYEVLDQYRRLLDEVREALDEEADVAAEV